MKKLTAKRRRELQKIINDAHDELDVADTAERFTENQAFVGKCFIYKNLFGSGDSWPLYTIITGLSKDGNLQSFQFEKNSYDEVHIKLEKWSGNHIMQNEIPFGEFLQAWNDIMNSVNTDFVKSVGKCK